MATQVQLGEKPQFQFYIAAIFFATLLEYNFHRLISVNNNTEDFPVEKNNWASDHLATIKLLILSSVAGLAFSMLFVRRDIIILFGLLSVFTLIYSAEDFGKNKRLSGFKGITGMKTIALAFVWTMVTMYLPIVQSETVYDPVKIIVLFAERFAFIFAIAIPFDIRDMETDSRQGVKSFPIVFGSHKAEQISYFALSLSAIVSIINYYLSGVAFVFLSCIISLLISFIAIKSKKLRHTSFYYHGILDGCLVLYGALVCLGFYLDKILK
jgi:4-hydroxybenzoate polyprenyltransferase